MLHDQRQQTPFRHMIVLMIALCASCSATDGRPHHDAGGSTSADATASDASATVGVGGHGGFGGQSVTVGAGGFGGGPGSATTASVSAASSVEASSSTGCAADVGSICIGAEDTGQCAAQFAGKPFRFYCEGPPWPDCALYEVDPMQQLYCCPEHCVQISTVWGAGLCQGCETIQLCHTPYPATPQGCHTTPQPGLYCCDP